MKKEQRLAIRIDNTVSRFSYVLIGISGAIILFMMVIAFADAVISKVSGNSIPHATEIITYFNVPAVFLGMGYVQLKDQHTVIELAFNKFPKGLQKACAIIMDILGVAFGSLITWRSIVFAIEKFNAGTLSAAIEGFKIWIFVALMAFGWLILTLCCLWCFIRTILGIEVEHTALTAEDRLVEEAAQSDALAPESEEKNEKEGDE